MEVQEELLEDDLEVPDALSTEKDDDFYKEVKPPAIREFKKLRWQLQRKRHIQIELCVKFSLLRLFHVGYVVQNRRSALSLASHDCIWFSCKGKKLIDLLLRARVVIRTSNLKISRRRVADDVNEM